MRLSDEQLSQYNTDGAVVVRELLPAGQVRQLCDRVREYTHGNRSTARLRVGMERGHADAELNVDHAGDAIRKIEGLVEYDDLFGQLGLHDNIVGIVEQILGSDIKMYRNSLLMKPPQVGSAKCVHQDSPYWPIKPMNLCSCWFALDDATEENGCMQVLPGWHRKGTLRHVGEGHDFALEPSLYDFSQLVPTPVPAGGGLFFHSLLPHYTAPNRSDRWRRAIALSYMSARSHYTGEGNGPEYFHVRGTTYAGCVR